MGSNAALDKSTAPQAVPIPAPTRRRFEAAGIDLSGGYPLLPSDFEYLQDAEAKGDQVHPYSDAGIRADPEKKELFRAAKAINHLTSHVGTEIVGLQLRELSDKQKDELALLVAERGVVFFESRVSLPRNRRLWAGTGASFIHKARMCLAILISQPSGQTSLLKQFENLPIVSRFKASIPSRLTDICPSDMVHERHPPGYTHLHKDAVPDVGGDLLWASGYAAYSKLSPNFRSFLDGKQAVFVSKERYIDRNAPSSGRIHPVTRTHPIIRVHPVTGWKSLYIAHGWVSHIVGLDKKESDLILGYLKDIYENNVDIQCRFKFTPGTSAIWDNRCTLHTASWDYENASERHGTRVTTLAEEPYYDEKATSRRQALGLEDD
ncbi:putative alpha-ketoglutarate-dependent taurine dioxygenase [Apiospora arundinis]